MLEAAVDFPDEELPADVAARARADAGARWPPSWRPRSADAERGERVREGYRIALVGAPNAGKSTPAQRAWPGATRRSSPPRRARPAT